MSNNLDISPMKFAVRYSGLLIALSLLVGHEATDVAGQAWLSVFGCVYWLAVPAFLGKYVLLLSKRAARISNLAMVQRYGLQWILGASIIATVGLILAWAQFFNAELVASLLLLLILIAEGVSVRRHSTVAISTGASRLAPGLIVFALSLLIGIVIRTNSPFPLLQGLDTWTHEFVVNWLSSNLTLPAGGSYLASLESFHVLEALPVALYSVNAYAVSYSLSILFFPLLGLFTYELFKLWWSNDVNIPIIASILTVMFSTWGYAINSSFPYPASLLLVFFPLSLGILENTYVTSKRVFLVLFAVFAAFNCLIELEYGAVISIVLVVFFSLRSFSSATARVLSASVTMLFGILLQWNRSTLVNPLDFLSKSLNSYNVLAPFVGGSIGASDSFVDIRYSFLDRSFSEVILTLALIGILVQVLKRNGPIEISRGLFAGALGLFTMLPIAGSFRLIPLLYPFVAYFCIFALGTAIEQVSPSVETKNEPSRFNLKRFAAIGVLFLIILPMATTPYSTYLSVYTTDASRGHQFADISSDEYSAALFIKYHLPANATIITDPTTDVVLKSVTGNALFTSYFGPSRHQGISTLTATLAVLNQTDAQTAENRTLSLFGSNSYIILTGRTPFWLAAMSHLAGCSQQTNECLGYPIDTPHADIDLRANAYLAPFFTPYFSLVASFGESVAILRPVYPAVVSLTSSLSIKGLDLLNYYYSKTFNSVTHNLQNSTVQVVGTAMVLSGNSSVNGDSYLGITSSLIGTAGYNTSQYPKVYLVWRPSYANYSGWVADVRFSDGSFVDFASSGAKEFDTNAPHLLVITLPPSHIITAITLYVEKSNSFRGEFIEASFYGVYLGS